MPTFTTIALESLLEPRFRDSYKNSTSKSASSDKVEKDDGEEESRKQKMEEEEKKKKKKQSRNRLNISPALYITPEPTPILHSESESFTPSPYVVNWKGRAGKSLNRRVDGNKEGRDEGEGKGDLDGERKRRVELQLEETVSVNVNVSDDFLGGDVVGDRVEGAVVEVEENEEDFLDTRCDSLSVASSGEVNDSGIRVGSLSVVSNQGDFYDADDGKL